MDTTTILNYLSEIAYLLIVFGALLGISVFKGRQAIINLTVGLYMALLISYVFPFYDTLLKSLQTSQSIATAKLGIFLIFTSITTALMYRIMPDEFRENKLESLGKKIILALGATVLVMIFSFQVLPVTEFLTPGTPIQSLFAPTEYFFWWLLLPLVILFV
jgi:uncharacterized membrane protein